jgi:hypothetical protein
MSRPLLCCSWCGIPGHVRQAGVLNDASVRRARSGLRGRPGELQIQRAAGPRNQLYVLKPLLERVERGEIDPSFVITHRMPLEDAPKRYRMFRNKQDNCEKIVLKPQQRQSHETVLRTVSSLMCSSGYPPSFVCDPRSA